MLLPSGKPTLPRLIKPNNWLNTFDFTLAAWVIGVSIKPGTIALHLIL